MEIYRRDEPVRDQPALIVVYVDGLCEPVNPGGVACWGFLAYRDGIKLFSGHGVVGEGSGMSNNVAEYSALINALRELINRNMQDEKVIVRSDSKLLVNQMNGWWNVHGGLYYPYYAEALKLAQNFRDIRFVWVPREENEEADKLSRQAYEEYCKAKGKKPLYHEDRIKKETCLTCKWVGFSGPHIGCFRDNKYRGWIPKKFAFNNKCRYYVKESS